MSRMTQDSTDAGAAAGIAPAVSAPDMTGHGDVMLAGILVLFVALSLALVVYQYLAVRGLGVHASPSRRGGGIVVGAGDRGVDPEVLRSLPVTLYRAKDTALVVECAVCLAELEDGEEARFLPGCGHGFHAECIDLWLYSHVTCPLCRLTVGKTDVSPAPPLALPPVPPEPARYATTSLPLPVSVMFTGAYQGAVTAVTITAGDHSSSSGCTAVLVIEIPELAPAPAPAPDTSKTPGSERLRSLGRLWSCGRQGAGSSAGSGADIEQGLGIGSPREGATPRAA